MAPSIPQSLYEKLPTPVARLLSQAALTREAKKRHDYAFAAWEAMFRLVVAASPPGDIASLRDPSLGQWRQALRLPNVFSKAEELLKFHAFFSDQLGQTSKPLRQISPQQLVELIPPYRNKFTTAHASPRADSFYLEATGHLVAALSRAWEEGFFWPPGAQLLYIPDIELDEQGRHLARIFALIGPTLHVLEEGTPVPEHVRRGRVYLRQNSEYRSLHPWVICRPHEIKERFFLFNSSNRGYEFLDCDSGDILDEQRLSAHGVNSEDFSQLPPRSGPGTTPLPIAVVAVEAPEASFAQTPAVALPPVVAVSESSPSQPPTYRSPPDRPATKRPSLPRPSRRLLLGGLGFVALTAGLALLLLPGHLGIPARSDWFFQDQEAGAGWLRRCRGHLAQKHPSMAEIACSRGVPLAKQPDLEAQLWLGLARASEQQQRPASVVDAAVHAYPRAVEAFERIATKASTEEVTAARAAVEEASSAIVQSCQGLVGKRKEPGLQDGVKAVVYGHPVLLRADSSMSSQGAALRPGSCVAVGPAAVRYPERDSEIWFEAGLEVDGAFRRGWVREEDLAPANDGAAWLARCRAYFEGGMQGQARVACQRGASVVGAPPAIVAQSSLTLGMLFLQLEKHTEAIERLIDAYKLSPPGDSKAKAGELIESICARGGTPRRTENDTRRYKAISWASKNDRFGNVRSEPSTTSSTSRILASLPRPTCVLAGAPRKVPLSGGGTELWFPVEAMVDQTPTQGWMHQVLLDPQ